MSADRTPVEPRTALLSVTGEPPWTELLHEWRVVSEHDGGYTLVRCRVCRTEVVR